MLAAVGFDGRLAGADLVITGEGRLDPTSLSGKGVGEVAARAGAAGVPCHAIVAVDGLPEAGRERFASVSEARTLEAIEAVAADIARRPT